jgi:hypothetical protein
MRRRRLPCFSPAVVDAQSTPAQEAKAEVYKELGYRTAGMVGQDLMAARPMVKAQGHIVQVIGPDGKTTKTLYRYRR